MKTSMDKIGEIVEAVSTSSNEWGFLRYLRQELKELVEIARTEGINESTERKIKFCPMCGEKLTK